MTVIGSTRDSQRQKVYNAEQLVRRILDRANVADSTYGHAGRQVEIHGSVLLLPIERRFGDVASIQRYVDAVLALNWVQPMVPQPAVAVTVRKRRGDAAAHYVQRGVSGPEIAVPDQPSDGRRRWAMREIVVLHEIAHHLTAAEEVSHGPRFAEVFLILVDGVMGAETAFVLRSSMHDAGVQIG